MKRLHQGHLHPNLEVPRLHVSAGNRTGPPWHSRKEPLDQLVNSYSEQLHMSRRQNWIKETMRQDL
jgi:hypothetical protein